MATFEPQSVNKSVNAVFLPIDSKVYAAQVFLWISLLPLVTVWGCKSSLEVETVAGAKVASAENVGTTDKNAPTVPQKKDPNSADPKAAPEAPESSKPQLSSIDRLVAKSGEVVKVSGKNLAGQKDLEIDIQGVRVPLTIAPDGSAEFAMPPGIKPGMGAVKLVAKARDGDLGQAALLADAGDYPISTMKPEEVCKDKKYRNAKGELITGTLECGVLPNCSSDGQTSCIAVASYTAAATTGLASKVLSGNTVAGVSGNVTLPTASNVYTGIQFGASGTQYTGTLTIPTAANVRTGNGAFGVGGTETTPTLADCSTNNVSGCVTTAAYKSADWTNLTAANIKNGVSVAGLTGTYPSAGNLLAGADATADLDTATFDAKVKSSSSFEFFGPDGSRYSNTGDADITAANIASGVTIFGTTGTATILAQCTSGVQATCEADTACRWNAGSCEINPWHIRAGITVASKAGSLKTNCRNTINNTYYNWDGSVASLINTGSTAGTAYDFWDTIDDYYGFSANKVTAWSSNTQCDGNNWTDVTTTNGGSSFTTCGTSSTCIYRDELSGLRVTGILSSGSNTTNTASPATYTWSGAINACNGSTYGGYSAGTWRLPTQKEMMSLYHNGIISRVAAGFHTLTNLRNPYWSSSGYSNSTGTGWIMHLANGYTNVPTKTNTYYALCVY